MIFRKIIIFIFCFYNLNTSSSYSNENKILFKINNEIISTIDIYNEIKYLKLINRNLKDLNQNNLYEISKNSLIRENIKKIALLKNNVKLNIDEINLQRIKKDLSKRLQLESDKELEFFLKQVGLNEKDVINKIIIENLWNSLIVKKFIKDVNIDEEKIRREIKEINYQYEYNLSELIFEIDANEKIDTKYKQIKEKIKQNSFEDTAMLLSISDTSQTGGLLGWIKESALSPLVKSELILLQPGAITKPLTIPGGILILKINNKRKVEKEIDVKKELKEIIRNKTNDQLNRFSVLYFNKIKKDILINEL